jgi:hypothetical protein
MKKEHWLHAAPRPAHLTCPQSNNGAFLGGVHNNFDSTHRRRHCYSVNIYIAKIHKFRKHSITFNYSCR